MEKDVSHIDSSIRVSRIVFANDTKGHQDWPKETIDKDIESIANFSIINFPKSDKSLQERSSIYNSSCLTSVSTILNGKTYYSYRDFLIRQDNMKTSLVKFLTQTENEKN